MRKEIKKIKSTFCNLDITPSSRFLLWKNILFSSLFFLSFCFLSLFFLLLSSSACFCQSTYLLSTFSNFILTSSDISPRISCHPTRITTLLYTFLAVPFSYIPLFLFFFLLLVISLLFLVFLQSYLPILLHSLNLPLSSMYRFLL